MPEAFYLLGLAHYQLGDYAKARPPAERAATMAPDAPASWLELVADALKRSDDQPRGDPVARAAHREERRATRLIGSSCRSRTRRSATWTARSRRCGSRNTAELLTDDAGFPPPVRSAHASRACRNKAPRCSSRRSRRATCTADEAAYTKLGTAWFTAGEPDKAVLPLENAARVASTGDAYVRLAVVHVAREDWPAAIAALHAGMGRGSLTDEGRANLLMGVALYAQGKFDEARDWFTMAAESEAQPRRSAQRLPRARSTGARSTRRACSELELLGPRPKVDLVRPRAAVLAVQREILTPRSHRARAANPGRARLRDARSAPSESGRR